MRLEARRKLDRLVWQRRARIGFTVTLAVIVLGMLYLYFHQPDPVVGTRIISGTVTHWMREQTDFGAGALGVWVTLDDGRHIVIRQPPLGVPRHGPAEIEERRHESGRISYLWLRSKPD